MVYEGDQALLYVKNYAAGSSQWDGFPIKVGTYASLITLAPKGSPKVGLNGCISVVMLHFNTTLSIIHLQVDVPKDRILLGAKGSTSSRFIMKLAREAVRQVILISDWLRLIT